MEGVYTYAVEPLLHEFASFTFEEICKQYVQKLQSENALPFRYSQIGRWFGKTTVRDTSSESGLKIAETEIDIAAVSRQMKEYLIGECKFKGKPFTYSEYLDTFAKLTPQKDKTAFYYALFSESGFDDRICEAAREDDYLYLFTLDMIVNGIS